MAVLVVLRVPDDALDAINQTIALRNILRAETHLEAEINPLLIDTVRRRQHPIIRDQRAAAVVLAHPNRPRIVRIARDAGVENLCLPRHRTRGHRAAAESVGRVIARRL